MGNGEVTSSKYFTGKTKAIGVSNYTIKHLEELVTSATVKPHVLQVCNVLTYTCNYVQ